MLLIGILPLLALLGVATADFDTAILERHNYYRQMEVSGEGALDMANLTYSDTLKNKAQAWADNCVWEHSPPQSRRGIGENLAMSSRSVQINLEREAYSSVNKWCREKEFYSYKNNNSTDEEEAVGHYKQVVWAKTTEIGCAYKRCTSGHKDGIDKEWNYVVCNYSPAGNIEGQKPYESNRKTKPCPNCSDGSCPSCKKNKPCPNCSDGSCPSCKKNKPCPNCSDGSCPSCKKNKPCPNCSDGSCSSCKKNKPSSNGKKMVKYAKKVAKYIKDLLAKLNGDNLSSKGKTVVSRVRELDSSLEKLLGAMKKV
ncbi:cysteine-rich venom protein pseudechetoxin-like [Lineus longissimus]|uniref:cysteine-rich venom protein pseudechetoxin-like n=1 Tax=Lineus longissimus TaxID=88925 RepID=UPI002B4CEAC2